MLLETTQKYRVDSEEQAKDLIEQFRAQAKEKGYVVKKAGYEYKTKKAKGEIIAEAWVVSVTQVFGELWEDLV
jgi:hypothetical protein